MSKRCYSPPKPFMLQDPTGGVAYSVPFFLIGGDGDGKDSNGPATVLHLFGQNSGTTERGARCAFPEGFDATGYGPGYSTDAGASGDRLARWVDKENGELWVARSDASYVHASATLVLNSDETKLVQLSAGEAFEALIADLGIVPFFPGYLKPNPHYFGIDHGIQADDVAAPEGRLRAICNRIKAKAAGAEGLANIVLLLLGMPPDQRSVGPLCSLAWAPRVSSGKWRLVSSISAGLSSDCVHVGAGSSSNLSSCQAECSSDARCNTINLFPGVAGAVTGACYFKACDATTGDIKLNANDGGWDVYTWLPGPILLHPSANLPAPRPSVSPSMERREGTARLPRCLATSVPAPSPTLPPCLVALHRSVPVRMVLVISI
jgi:hypothetical protein